MSDIACRRNATIAGRMPAWLTRRLSWRRWRRPLLLGNVIAIGLAIAIIALRAGYIGREVETQSGIDPLHPYAITDYGAAGGFYYSPAYALALAPLGFLPWPAFVGLLMAMEITALGWLVGWRWIGYALLLLPVMDDVMGPNINLALAVAVVLGLELPFLWAFVLLTKVTPGIGILWFAVRREWRHLATAVGVTAAIALVSFAITPDAWWRWASVLLDNAGRPVPDIAFPLPLVIRLPIAAALVVIGARTGRTWLVPVAAFLSLAIIWREHDALLLGAVAAWRRSHVRAEQARAMATEAPSPAAFNPSRAIPGES
jgi:hypothetical protein